MANSPSNHLYRTFAMASDPKQESVLGSVRWRAWLEAYLVASKLYANVCAKVRMGRL